MMEQCRKLYEYAYLVEQVRLHLAQGLVLAAAIDQAVEECIKKGILEEFLLTPRDRILEKLQKRFSLDREAAVVYYKKYAPAAEDKK